jgi:excisionase family DNA binding protein
MGSTYSVRDVRERHGVSEGTVLSWIRAGELRAVNVGRRPGAKKPRWRITPEALEAFEQLRTPTPRRASSRRRSADATVIEFYRENEAVVAGDQSRTAAEVGTGQDRAVEAPN